MSDTPRTDDLIGNKLGRLLRLDPQYAYAQAIIEHAKQLERENADLRAEIERMRESHSDEAISDLEMRLSVTQQEIERMRPVVEAAVKWSHIGGSGGGPKVVGDAWEALDNAVDDYEANK